MSAKVSVAVELEVEIEAKWEDHWTLGGVYALLTEEAIQAVAKRLTATVSGPHNGESSIKVKGAPEALSITFEGVA